MTADEVVKELRSMGSESIKKVLLKHGAKEPFYGVKIEDLKKIQKRVKTGARTSSSPGGLAIQSISCCERHFWRATAILVCASLAKCVLLPWGQSTPGSISAPRLKSARPP